MFVVMGALGWWGTKDTKAFYFENTDGDFEEILKAYLDIAKFILTLAAGGIVLSRSWIRNEGPVCLRSW
jgi:hypothetical protein